MIEVHGYARQGAGFGYNGVRGRNARIATVSTGQAAPVIVAQRLRKGSANSARGAQRLVADAGRTVRGLAGSSCPARAPHRVLLRADSAFYGHAVVGAAVKTGAEVSVTVRLDGKVKAAIAAIGEQEWTTIAYPNAIFEEATGQWISRAEVAEIDFTAFTSKPRADQVPAGRWCAGSPTWRRGPTPGRTACSRCGATTRSSPPHRARGPTPWPSTRSTVAPRSSSRSTPT